VPISVQIIHKSKICAALKMFLSHFIAVSGEKQGKVNFEVYDSRLVGCGTV